MKTEEEIILLTNNIQNKIALNQIISFNHNTNDFKKINSSVNIINTSGSQPIVIFKKISKSLTQPFNLTKKQKPSKAVDNIIHNKKLNKYKSVLSFPNQQQISNSNANIIKNNKNSKNIKTLRTLNKKTTDNKKRKELTKSKEKLQTHILKINNNNKYVNKRRKNNDNNNKKEINQKQRHELKNINNNNCHKKESHSHGHFNRKEKIMINNFISKSTNEIKYIKNNNNIHDNTPNYNINVQKNNKNIKFRIKKENKNKLNEESKIAEQIEQEQKKSEYMESLIKNGILNVSKKFKLVKKPTKKEIITKKKKEFLLENGITENLINNNINKNIQNFHSMSNLNDIKQIKKKNISTKNSYKKQKNLNISKSNSRFISLLNNNSNINITNVNTNINFNYINSTNTNLITTNINQETQQSNKNSKKRTILKPQINQFEYINRIQQEQKKLTTQQNNKTIDKNLDTNECESKLSDSFRHNNKIQNLNLHIKNFEKAKKNFSIKHGLGTKFPHEKNQKILDQIENDEFPFSHRKSYRSPQEIMKYLKEKRIETKKEEENTEKEKQLKAYVTFQNLINIGKRNENNINITKIEPKFNANKIRKESNKQ